MGRATDEPIVDAELTRVFGAHRDRLRSVAYRMLGRSADAEDVVQDTWLRWRAIDLGTIDDPEAYLVRITTRLAIDRLRSATARREVYVGPWLPEPVLTSPDVADNAALADSVSSALLLVLESLSPMERAVFVLHEAFDYPYRAVADIIGRSEAAVRQTALRARKHVQARRASHDVDRQTRREVTEAFLAAAAGGDLEALMRVLAPDVTLVSDGGGLAPAPRKAIAGLAHVARALVLFASRTVPDQVAEVVDVNGGPGIVVYAGAIPLAALTLHLTDGRVHTVHLVSNPEKLAALSGTTPLAE